MQVENTYLERDQGYCWDVRDEYLRHFLNNEFVTGVSMCGHLWEGGVANFDEGDAYIVIADASV